MVDQNLLDSHVSFFDASVLNLYRHDSHLYKVTFDYFAGSLSSVFSDTDSENDLNESRLSKLTFGCRTKVDGSVAIAVLNYEFSRMPAKEKSKWIPHKLEANDLIPLPDGRFQMWYNSHLEGDWDIGNPPLLRLAVGVDEANKVAAEGLGEPLFRSAYDNDLHFPISENSDAYESAHAKLYIYLIDGFRKEALNRLANKVNVPVNIGSSKTVKILETILTTNNEGLWREIESSLQPVQKSRRRNAHEARTTVAPFPAFETFVEDLEPIIDSISALTRWIATICGESVGHLLDRHSNREFILPFSETRQIAGNYSINRLMSLQGKTISKVEIGFRRDIEGLHSSEMAILHSSDGAEIAIMIGSNIENVLSGTKTGIRADDFELRFEVVVVPGTDSFKN